MCMALIVSHDSFFFVLLHNVVQMKSISTQFASCNNNFVHSHNNWDTVLIYCVIEFVPHKF